jgi:hypothetical protein
VRLVIIKTLIVIVPLFMSLLFKALALLMPDFDLETLIVIVPLFMSLLFKALALLMPDFDLATCVFAMDDIIQVSIILVPPLATFLLWSETTSRVPVWTLPMFKVMTLCFVMTVECRVNHGCCVQHRLEALHVCINFFVVL